MKSSILVIEDEEDIRTSIAEILEYEEIACILAQNGMVGAQLARDFVPDLIICDILMPGLDGYGVLADLRGDALTMNIPFIFLSAKADKSSLRYGMGLGADDYLTKPFTSDELIAAVNTRLKKKAQFVREFTNQTNDLRESLIHSLPHELQTPLFGILGGAQVLLNDPTTLRPEEVAEMAQLILESGKRLQRLINNYLLYAQLQIIRLDPERLSVLRHTTMEFPDALIKDVAGARAIKTDRTEDLVLNVEDGTASISAEHLKKLVEEIMDNAFKFSNRGTKVTVSANIKDDRYVIEISDCGSGMSIEQITKVGAFMQFERELNEQQGSGLGLAIANRLVELHQGELLIQSEPERGTRIQIKLPIGATG